MTLKFKEWVRLREANAATAASRSPSAVPAPKGIKMDPKMQKHVADTIANLKIDVSKLKNGTPQMSQLQKALMTGGQKVPSLADIQAIVGDV